MRQLALDDAERRDGAIGQVQRRDPREEARGRRPEDVHRGEAGGEVGHVGAACARRGPGETVTHGVRVRERREDEQLVVREAAGQRLGVAQRDARRAAGRRGLAASHAPEHGRRALPADVELAGGAHVREPDPGQHARHLVLGRREGVGDPPVARVPEGRAVGQVGAVDGGDAHGTTEVHRHIRSRAPSGS